MYKLLPLWQGPRLSSLSFVEMTCLIKHATPPHQTPLSSIYIPQISELFLQSPHSKDIPLTWLSETRKIRVPLQIGWRNNRWHPPLPTTSINILVKVATPVSWSHLSCHNLIVTSLSASLTSFFCPSPERCNLSSDRSNYSVRRDYSQQHPPVLGHSEGTTPYRDAIQHYRLYNPSDCDPIHGVQPTNVRHHCSLIKAAN